ncbi:MAG: hypothetical protein SGILL_007829 [Bacillariaceae sp.]
MKFGTSTIFLVAILPAFGYTQADAEPSSQYVGNNLRGKESSSENTSMQRQRPILLRGRPEVTPLQDNDVTLYNPAEPVHVDIDWIWSRGEDGHDGNDDSEQAAIHLVRYKVNGLAVETTLWNGDDDDDDNVSGSGTISLDRTGAFDLTVSVCTLHTCSDSDPIQVTIHDGGGLSEEDSLSMSSGNNDSATNATAMSFQEAVDWVHEQSKRLKEERSDRNDDVAMIDPITSSVVAKFFGKMALEKLGELGMDKLFAAFGWTGDDTAKKLDELGQSLTAVQTQLDQIGKLIDQNHADSKFNTAHTATLKSIATIKGIARLVSRTASGEDGEQPYATLNDWAYDNYKDVAALEALLLDATSGAIPLMLELFAIKYPTTGLIQVRAHIVDYVDGIRATLGLAVMNQAWLQEQDSRIGVYGSDVEKYSLDIGNRMYETIGASYPVSADRAMGSGGFLHRVGEDRALVGRSYVRGSATKGGPPQLPGEVGGLSKAETRKEIDSLVAIMNSSGAGVWNGVTIQDWMEKNSVWIRGVAPNLFFDNVRHQQSTSSLRLKWTVTVDILTVQGNNFAWKTHTAYSKECPVPQWGSSSCVDGAKKEAANIEARLRSDVAESSARNYIKEGVSRNNYGMPALMDPDLIAQERDGIVVHRREQEVDSNGVQVITLSVVDHYGTIADGAYRAVDPATGKTLMCYFSDSSTILPAEKHIGQVILQAGYKMHGPGPSSPGNCDLVVRQSTLVDDLMNTPVQLALEKLAADAKFETETSPEELTKEDYAETATPDSVMPTADVTLPSLSPTGDTSVEPTSSATPSLAPTGSAGPDTEEPSAASVSPTPELAPEHLSEPTQEPTVSPTVSPDATGSPDASRSPAGTENQASASVEVTP